jgi:hypothetical protein
MGAGGESAFLFWNRPGSAWSFVLVGARSAFSGLAPVVTVCHRLSLEGFVGEMKPGVPLALLLEDKLSGSHARK